MKDVTRIGLTGEIAAEITDASATSMMSVVERRYELAVLEPLGLGAFGRLLPPLVESAAIAGQVHRAAAAATGLAAGTPVAGGLFDIDACLLAAGITDESAVGVAAGTWGSSISPRLPPRLRNSPARRAPRPPFVTRQAASQF